MIGAHICVALFYFVYPLVGTGARGWVDCILLAARVVPSCRGVVGLLVNCRVVLGA